MFITDTMSSFYVRHYPIKGVVLQLNEVLHALTLNQAFPRQIRDTVVEALCCNLLLVADKKHSGTMVTQIENVGDLELLVAKATQDLQVCATARWDARPGADYSLQSGKMVASWLSETCIEPQQSIVSLSQSSVSLALEQYYSRSDQVPTRFWCHVDGDNAWALMLQTLPSAHTDILSPADSFLQFSLMMERYWQEASRASFCLQDHRMESHFTDYDFQSDVARPIQYHCSCSMEKMQQALLTLGVEEVTDVLEQHSVVEVTCDFCARNYSFSRAEIDDIFSSTS